MRSSKYPFMVIAGYLALIGVLAATTPQTAHTQSSPTGPNVRVINTPAEPVPVMLLGPASIDTSAPLPFRDVDNPARHAVQTRITGSGTSYTVPDGKRLVIEFVSGEMFSIAGVITAAVVETHLDGNEVFHRFPPTRSIETPGSPSIATFGQMSRIYADGGTEVSVSAASVPQDTVGVAASISGYLVDMP